MIYQLGSQGNDDSINTIRNKRRAEWRFAQFRGILERDASWFVKTNEDPCWVGLERRHAKWGPQPFGC